jgi:hypothetical protein
MLGCKATCCLCDASLQQGKWLNQQLSVAAALPLCCWLQALADMLVEVCKNPKSPGFNHYLFESVAALIKHGAAADKAQLATYEATLFPAFDIVLSNDVQVRPSTHCCLQHGCSLLGRVLQASWAHMLLPQA